MTTAQLSVLTSASLALLALSWNVLSWRRSGPRLHARALLGGNKLRLVIVNTGRTADVVTAFFLGGSIPGRGYECTGLLPADEPHKLEPATPLDVTLDLDDAHHEAFLTRARAGFESVWIGLDPLRSIRADVVPVGKLTRASTWQLRYRAGLVRRYQPLAAAVALTAAAHSVPDEAAGARFVLGAALVVSIFVWFALAWRRQMFARAGVERSLTAGALLTAMLVAGSAAPTTRALAPNVAFACDAFLILGAVLARPTQVASVWSTVSTAVALLRGNFGSRSHHLDD